MQNGTYQPSAHTERDLELAEAILEAVALQRIINSQDVALVRDQGNPAWRVEIRLPRPKGGQDRCLS